VNLRNFFVELKRRNFIRMAGLYLVGAHSLGKHWPNKQERDHAAEIPLKLFAREARRESDLFREIFATHAWFLL
jgi:hypothetical protein